MDEKMRFMVECLAGEEPMTMLCERHGISRQTGYTLKRRYEAEGVLGLEERSRAPHQHGRTTAAELVVRLVELRQLKPHWGGGPIAALAIAWDGLGYPSP
jgi:transposase